MFITAISSLYVHFPFCRHLCNYCDFHKKVPTSKDEISDFEQSLIRSWDRHGSFIESQGFAFEELKTIYIGGGTPSMWGAHGIEFFRELLAKNKINLHPDCEFTLELNPGNWKIEDLIRYKDFGVNRISVGVQSLNDSVLKILDRVHSTQDVLQTLSRLNELSFNFSVDFMLGLPKLNKDLNRNIDQELDRILSFGPSHISSYILTVNKNYKHYSILPEEDFVSDEYLRMSHRLSDSGFGHYEVSNFAKPGYHSEHNLMYWKSKSVAAIGPSATGFLRNEQTGVRYKWKTNHTDSFTIEEVTKNELKLERFFLHMRTSQGTNLFDFLSADTISSLEQYIRKLDEQGFLACSDLDNFVLSSKGFLCSDSIISKISTHF